MKLRLALINLIDPIERIPLAGRRAINLSSRPELMQVIVLPAHCDLEHIVQRSEEHTSELQSLAYLVCRLLLEKKNQETRSGHPPRVARRGKRPTASARCCYATTIRGSQANRIFVRALLPMCLRGSIPGVQGHA